MIYSYWDTLPEHLQDYILSMVPLPIMPEYIQRDIISTSNLFAMHRNWRIKRAHGKCVLPRHVRRYVEG